MDPQANLKEQLEIANEIIGMDEAGESLEDVAEQVVRLAELVTAYCEWVSKGGTPGFGEPCDARR